MKKNDMAIDTLLVYTEQRSEDGLETTSERELEELLTEFSVRNYKSEKSQKVGLGKVSEEDLDLRKTREYMEKSFRNFSIVKELGSGSRGKNKIYLIRKKSFFLNESIDSSNVEEYALKKISIIRKKKNKNDCTETELENYEKKRQERIERVLKSEQRNMTNLKDSQYVVRMLGYELWDYEYDDEFGACIFIQMRVYETLKEQLRKREEFSENEIKEIMRDIGRALEDCKKSQIIHCDIKPSNIFYDRDKNRYLLGDFGASVHKNDMDMIGCTILYAAPEQLRREKVDFYTDVYSFGLTLYQIANNNSHPFIKYRRATCEENIEMRLEHDEDLEFPKGSLSEKVAKLLIKACKYDENERYQSITEFLDALDEIDFPTYTAIMDEGEDFSHRILGKTDISNIEKEGEKEDLLWNYLNEKEDYVQGADYTGKCGENVFFAFRKSTGHLHIYGKGEIVSVHYYAKEESFAEQLGEGIIENRKELDEGVGIISVFEEFIEDIVAITIHENIIKIDDMAFIEFPKLKYVLIGPDIKRIPYRCFMNCKKLRTIFLPENLLEIDDMAFFGCEALEKINFPQNMYRIGVAAFKKCKKLTVLSLTKIEEIDWFAFQESGLEKVHLWDIRKIGREAFSNSFCLKKVYIGSYWMIEKACFANSSIEILEIGNKGGGFGYKIEDDILLACKNLEKISINMEAVCKTKAFEMYREILTVHEVSALKKIFAGFLMKSIGVYSNHKNYSKIKMEYEERLK